MIFLSGCAAPSGADRLTLGVVQDKIHVGMAQADVQAALGSPNIISKNSDSKQVWTYDKVSKESAARWFFFWTSSESTQRTLTVLITFDDSGRVEDYTYHATEF
tara:strand:+ start:615 stop:926 length:312 start_codon:yes stop_codon:yes gene_type:complete